MDIKQLRSFVAVVDCGSFTRAAERLSISQPSVSAHVHQLEDELRERLFLRTTKSLAITPRGRELYEYAAHVLALQDRLFARWAEDATMIRLAASTIPSTYILPELLPRYRALQPDVTFEIFQSDSRGVLDGVREGRFALGLAGMQSADDTLIFTPFYRDHMVLITPNNERFAAAKAQGEPVADILRGEPLLLREEGSGSQKCVDDFFRAAGLGKALLHVTARMNDQESVKNLVAGGLGVSVVSGKAVEAERENGRLLVFPLPNDCGARELCLVQPRGDGIDPQAEHFAAFVRSFYHAER